MLKQETLTTLANGSSKKLQKKQASVSPITNKKEIENYSTGTTKRTSKGKDAFKKKDAELFLIYHLSVARHDETPQVPLSSLPENILTGWEEIIITKATVH